jgi:hypothetical protein
VTDKYGKTRSYTKVFNDRDRFSRFGKSWDWYTCYARSEGCNRRGWTLAVSYKLVATSAGDTRYARYTSYVKDSFYQDRLPQFDSRYYRYAGAWHRGY